MASSRGKGVALTQGSRRASRRGAVGALLDVAGEGGGVAGQARREATALSPLQNGHDT